MWIVWCVAGVVVQAIAGSNGAKVRSQDTLEVKAAPVVVHGAPTSARIVMRDSSEVRLIASKKAEAVLLSPGEANLALNNTRQAFGRVAGVMLWENDGTGIQANLAVRGLSPNRSWEFNTRMDGADIAADIAGYPEAYFTPAFESLERIEIIRGAAALQYGPQFGGLLNYVTKSPPRDRALSIESSQMGGQNGYYSTYTAIGGTGNQWSYYAFVNYRRSDGWRLPVQLRDGTQRESDRFWQYSVMPKFEYRPSEKLRLNAEAVVMQYRLQQPGGLDSAQYAINPRQAMRYRDWFGVRWIVPSLTLEYTASDRWLISAKAFGVVGDRESIGLTTVPTIPDTGSNPRRVNTDNYRNVGFELRTRYDAATLPVPTTVAAGIRVYHGSTLRKQGRGPDGEDFNTQFVRPLTRDLQFGTTNLAAFLEAQLRLSSTLSITPGVRFEMLRMTGQGSYSREKPASSPDAFDTSGVPLQFSKRATETLPLFGLGVLWQATSSLDVYANAYQSWRPAQFSELFPNDPTVAVDPALHSSRGVSTDVGVRGMLGTVLSFDVSAFYLYYGDRIGTLPRSALGADTVLVGSASQLRRNVGTSEHSGVEAYAELFANQLLPLGRHAVSIFLSSAYTHARYTGGPAAGKRVEYAPEWIIRWGLRYQWSDVLTISLQSSYVSECYSDAANTLSSSSGVNGIIPAYTVWDASAVVRITSWLQAELNVNNLLDTRYFTRRAGGYPGPGIIPADGRVVTGGVRVLL